MVPPIAGLGPATEIVDEKPQQRLLTPTRLTRVRAVLLGLSLLLGLVVYVFHSLGVSHMAHPELVKKLRGVGMLRPDWSWNGSDQYVLPVSGSSDVSACGCHTISCRAPRTGNVSAGGSEIGARIEGLHTVQ